MELLIAALIICALAIAIEAHNDYIKTQWIPKFKTNDLVIFNTNELAKWVGSNTEMGTILPMTGKELFKYYSVKCHTMKNHRDEPMIMQVHEEHLTI